MKITIVFDIEVVDDEATKNDIVNGLMTAMPVGIFNVYSEIIGIVDHYKVTGVEE